MRSVCLRVRQVCFSKNLRRFAEIRRSLWTARVFARYVCNPSYFSACGLRNGMEMLRLLVLWIYEPTYLFESFTFNVCCSPGNNWGTTFVMLNLNTCWCCTTTYGVIKWQSLFLILCSGWELCYDARWHLSAWTYCMYLQKKLFKYVYICCHKDTTY